MGEKPEDKLLNWGNYSLSFPCGELDTTRKDSYVKIS
jgi:hypothetical protein